MGYHQRFRQKPMYKQVISYFCISIKHQSSCKSGCINAKYESVAIFLIKKSSVI